jgi:hypothetical protein
MAAHEKASDPVNEVVVSLPAPGLYLFLAYYSPKTAG